MKVVINRFLTSGLTMDDISIKMDVSIGDLDKLLYS